MNKATSFRISPVGLAGLRVLAQEMALGRTGVIETLVREAIKARDLQGKVAKQTSDD